MTYQLDKKKPNMRKLDPGASVLRQEESNARQTFYAVITDPNLTVEEVTQEIFWAHHAARFQVGNGNGFPEITLVWEDGSKYVRLLVLSASRLAAKVRVIEVLELSAPASQDDEPAAEDDAKEDAGEAPFVYAWKGNNKKHCIIRKADNEIVREGYGSKDEALKELGEMLRAQAA